MSFYFPNFGTVIFRLYMLKKELRKILLSLSFVFVVAVSYAQYVVTGGSGSPMKATQSSGDSAERLEVYLVYGMDNVTISYTSSSSSHQWYHTERHPRPRCNHPARMCRTYLCIYIISKRLQLLRTA